MSVKQEISSLRLIFLSIYYVRISNFQKSEICHVFTDPITYVYLNFVDT